MSFNLTWHISAAQSNFTRLGPGIANRLPVNGTNRIIDIGAERITVHQIAAKH
jgi:hypothetical protein